ncbi:MAG: hypothetical protein Q7P63_01425 [Verrucomicrobiota bacterium JB022]|nr:hypothetical protein [Verrucomicrobiota bacterium JB022]
MEWEPEIRSIFTAPFAPLTEDGWRWSYLYKEWIYEGYYPWVSSATHGWQWASSIDSNGNYWLYDSGMGRWVMHSRALFPNFYVFAEDGTGDGWYSYIGKPGQYRRFWSYDAQAYVFENEF